MFTINYMVSFLSSMISGTSTFSYPPEGTNSCPGSNITYTCVHCSSFAGVITVWRGSAFTCPSIGSQVANRLSLYQKSGGAINPNASGSCGSLSAVTTNVSTDGYCYTSVLTIPDVQSLNGTTVMCVDGVTSAVVGNDTVNVEITGELGRMHMQVYCVTNYSTNGWFVQCYSYLCMRYSIHRMHIGMC